MKGKLCRNQKTLKSFLNEYFANVDIKMANSSRMLHEEVKAPRNNNYHSARIKYLFLKAVNHPASSSGLQ